MRPAPAPLGASEGTHRRPGHRARRERRPGGGRCDRGRGAEAGYSTIEAVLFLPVLLALTLIVVQYALVWHARSVVESAARHGVGEARAYTATDADGLRRTSAYLQAVDPALLRAAHIEVSRTATTVAVRIRAQVLPVPGVPFTIGVEARSSAPVERFVAPEGAP